MNITSKLSSLIICLTALFCCGCHTVANQKFFDAAESGDLNQVKFFVTNRTDINSADNRGRTALYCASLVGQTNVVNYLLNHGADPNKGASWKGNQRPLHVAAMYGHVEILKDLLVHDANVDACTTSGETAL